MFTKLVLLLISLHMVGSVVGDSEFKCSKFISYIHTDRCFVTDVQVLLIFRFSEGKRECSKNN